MPIIIGTDEAGLGPNLGPLVVTATTWDSKQGLQGLENFAKFLKHVDLPLQHPLVLGDSKSVYQSGGTLQGLEQVVLPALSHCKKFDSRIHTNGSVSDFVLSLTNQAFADHDQILFLSDHVQIPVSTSEDNLNLISNAWTKGQEINQCFLLQVDSLVIFPQSFNQQIDRWDNKSTLLTSTTLGMVKKALSSCCEDAFVVCDRHGGRKNYHSSIQQFITDCWVTIESETDDLSAYSWSQPASSCNIEFVTRGERFPAVGLASMVSKYVRELTMQNWNRFWEIEIPGIKPTAGYPTDAKRFFNEIKSALNEHNLTDDQLWRSR